MLYYHHVLIILYCHATGKAYVDKINKVLVDGISDNMAALVKTDKYCVVNITYTTTISTMWLDLCQNLTHHKKKTVIDKYVLLLN